MNDKGKIKNGRVPGSKNNMYRYILICSIKSFVSVGVG